MTHYIEGLKQQVIKAEAARQQLHLSMRERDELEQREIALEQRLLSNQNHSELADQIKQDTELLKTIKKKKQDLDNQLDGLEEYTEERINLLRNQLAEATLKEYPEEQDRYLTLQGAIDQTEQLIHEMTHAKATCVELEKLLDGALVARKNVQRKSILSYIIGPNPNLVISQYLQAIETLATQNIPKTQQAELIDLLSELKAQSKKLWGFRHIDQMCQFAQPRAHDLNLMYEKALVHLQEVHQKQLKVFDEWLNKG